MDMTFFRSIEVKKTIRDIIKNDVFRKVGVQNMLIDSEEKGLELFG
jgi:hypothetical protein